MESSESKKFHQNIKKIFKLKKPSPIMTDLIDPETNEAAIEKVK